MVPSENFPIAPKISVSEALARAHEHWRVGHGQQAELLCLCVLEVMPHQPDALHLLGLLAHAYGKLELSVMYLRKACLSPDVPATYDSNLAEICRQQGLLKEAEAAARRAVAKAPELSAAWNNLGIILQESGDVISSLECLERVAALQPDASEIHNNLGNTYKRLNDLQQAQKHYQRALDLNPNYAEAYSNLAFLLNSLGHFDEATKAGRTAIDINPHLIDAYLNLANIEMSRNEHHQALRWLDALAVFAPQYIGAITARAQILKKIEHYDEALVCARQAVTLAPDSASAHHVLGLTLQALGEHDAALECFNRAVTLPGTVAEEALIASATLLMEIGNKEQAANTFDKVLQLFPGSARALSSRADTKRYQTDDPDISAMENCLRDSGALGLNEKIDLHFALGKAYLDIDDSDQAFSHLNRGNALKRATFSYDATATELWMDKIAATFTPALMKKFENAGPVSERPVFIIGMPRSGTTLVEQILASHPDVHGAGELSALRRSVNKAGQFPDDISHWTAENLYKTGSDYLAQIDGIAPSVLRVVDKMPSNFLYAGLIPLILPGARIVHCRRDPMDTCLSCYSKNFSGQQLFSYELTELGRFHRGYQSLLERLRELLPENRFLEVDYEAVVDDLDGQAKRLIKFLGLSWDPACLSFYRTHRAIRTASVSQVRQPIYTSSKGRWKKHAAHLGLLLTALDRNGPISNSATYAT